MCGISGIVYHDRQRCVGQDDLKKMVTVMKHRGPDDEGYFIDQNAGLAVRRLEVIDLVTGHQPITNEDQSVWLVFNGEVYNYLELRKELENKGHKFSTNTDTEVIVHSYEEHGLNFVEKLNGMFAIALWDCRDRKLVLARDRLGVKPLYYYTGEDALVFGSELKALLAWPRVPRSIDFAALDTFLTFEYIPAPASIFQYIRKLLPGHVLVLEDGKVKIHQYWDLCFGETSMSEEDLCQSLRDLLKDAVRKRLVSDVPVGAFLSGGIDSSTIVCFMNELSDRSVKTFSIGFDDPSYNELPYARLAARHFGTDHHERTVRPDIVSLVPDLIRHLDEPLADVSIFPTYLVSQLARQHVTVVLSGDGGDELFAGYDWYIADKIAHYYRYLPAAVRNNWVPWVLARIPPSPDKKGFVNKLKRFVEGAVLPQSLRHFRWNTFLTEETKDGLYTDAFKNSMDSLDAFSRLAPYLNGHQETDRLWQAQFADIKTYLADDILTKVDRMSMAHSLEARSPFLDYRLVEFTAGLPSHLKLNGFRTKYLLKKTMAAKLPREILSRKKEGFSVPMKNWLKQELRPLMEDVLSPARINREGLFQGDYIEKLKADHLHGKANYAHQLWSLMVFEIWRDLYLR